MANMSNYLEEKILDHVFRGVDYTPPTDVYVAIFTSMATGDELEQGILTNEITEYEGDRKLVTFNAPAREGDTDPTEIDNDIKLEFEGMPDVEVEFAAIMDTDGDAEDGNILYWLEPADGTRDVSENDIVVLPIEDVVLDID